MIRCRNTASSAASPSVRLIRKATIFTTVVLALTSAPAAFCQIESVDRPYCVSKTDHTATLYLKKACELCQKMKLKDGLDYVNMSLHHDANFGAAYILKGFIMQKNGESREAVALLNKGLSLTPECKDSAAYFFLGQADNAVGDNKAALAAFTRGIKMVPGSAWLYSERARLYGLLNQQDKACADYDASVKYGPKDPGAIADRGVNYLRLHQYVKALADFDKSIQLNAGDPSVHMDRGNALKAMGRIKEANEAFAKAKTLTSQDF